jgi:hypothetical protein
VSGAGAPSRALSERAKRRVRLGVLVLTVLFVVQLGYVNVAEEPYPAIMMPRFSWAGPAGSMNVDIMVPEIVMSYADGTSRTITQKELLGDVPTGHHSIIMNNIMSPLPATLPTRRAPPNKLEPPASLFRGYNLARVSRQQPEHVQSLRTWLAERARAFHQGAPPRQCVVRWYDDTFSYDTQRSADTGRLGRRLTGTFVLDLD